VAVCQCDHGYWYSRGAAYGGADSAAVVVFTIGGSRALACFWLGGPYHSQLKLAALPRALVYGAGRAGRQLVSALSKGYEMCVVGFLDDYDRLHGHALNGNQSFPLQNYLC